MNESTGVTGDWTQTSFTEVLNKGLGDGVAYVVANPALVFFAASALAFATLWLMQRRKKPKSHGEQDDMKRRTQLESTYADKIHDFMLDMLGKGEITRKEYKRDCKRFGIAFRLTDLLRSPRSRIGIRHRVLRNIAANHSTLPYIQPGPGPKPGENQPASPVKSKRRVWIVVGKRRNAT